MPFKWKRKQTVTSPERMKRAVKEVADGCPLRTTPTKYDIDKMTLRRYVMKYKEIGEGTKFVPNFATSQIFYSEEEKNLSAYLVTAANMNYGLTS
ncbi:hypothetical protein JTB14_028562 [Gonioctena quinquepunctata]|nr:hypothetical protein JTB14_028562 [Gonioctena quinquepunctata]